MEHILENLRKKEVLPSKGIPTIKEYIHRKYPDYPSNRTSAILADAVHKIIDRNIEYFNREYQNKIKKNLFNQITKKDEFSINAYDIFEACTLLDLDEVYYIENLTDWINNNQSEYISKEKVAEISEGLKDVLLSRALSFETQSLSFKHETPSTDIIIDDDTNTISHQIIISEEVSSNSPDSFSAYTPTQDNLEVAGNSVGTIKRLLLKTAKQLYTFFHLVQLRTTNRYLMGHLRTILVVGALTLLLFTGIGVTNSIMQNKHLDQTSIPIDSINQLQDTSEILQESSGTTNATSVGNHLQTYLQYKEVNLDALKNWLISRNSLLAEEPYFNGILNAAKEHNINPLLMFAITGQEQAFVPKSHADAESIANNPFNVYGSWEDYNTDIDDTSTIAAKTILNLSEGCPENEDAIKWINQKYAEDENWYLGVSTILSQLEKVATSEQ